MGKGIDLKVEHNFDLFGARMFKRAPGMCRESMADTLNHMANGARKHTGKVMPKFIDRPTPFIGNTKRSMWVSPARAHKLVSATGFKNKQKEVLSFVLYGGTRTSGHGGRVLVGVKKYRTNRFGNVPNKRKRLAGLLNAARYRGPGTSGKGSVFWGPPKGRRHQRGKGEGLYVRVGVAGRDAVQKTFHAVQDADYEERFDFERHAVGYALGKFEDIAVEGVVDAFKASRRRA